MRVVDDAGLLDFLVTQPDIHQGSRLLERRDEVSTDEPRVARDLCRQLGEALLGDRITIDPDQRPGGADPFSDEACVSAAAERAIDGDLARQRIEQLERIRPDRLASLGIARTLQGVGLFGGLTVLENAMVGASRFRRA